MKNKIWRPRLHENSVSINREGKFFAINCRNFDEAEKVEQILIKTLIKARKD